MTVVTENCTTNRTNIYVSSVTRGVCLDVVLKGSEGEDALIALMVFAVVAVQIFISEFL
jgi:hypothetical protein